MKEVGSSASERQLREKLLESARRRGIDVVLVWRLDRWGRSVTDLLATLQELEHLGVGSEHAEPTEFAWSFDLVAGGSSPRHESR